MLVSDSGNVFLCFGLKATYNFSTFYKCINATNKGFGGFLFQEKHKMQEEQRFLKDEDIHDHDDNDHDGWLLWKTKTKRNRCL